MRLLTTEATNIRNRTTIVLERDPASGLEPIKLTLHALPPTYADEAEAEIPTPAPPKLGVSRDRKGRIDKDAQGRPIMLYDEQDREYRKALAEANELQAVKMIVDALDPSEIQFEAERDGRAPRDYYAAVRREMIEFGFSIGDNVNLIKAVARVSNLSEDDVKAARFDFFEKGSSQNDS